MATPSYSLPSSHWARHRHSARPATRLAMPAIHRPIPLLGIGMVGVLLGAWAGIAPFVGPYYGVGADNFGAMYWDLARALLAVIPGVAGLVAGLMIIASARSWELSLGRGTIGMAGLLAMAAGGWLTFGPISWFVLYNHPYLTSSAPLMELTRMASYSAGPGLLMMAIGGVAFGSLLRHPEPVTVMAGDFGPTPAPRPVEDVAASDAPDAAAV